MPARNAVARASGSPVYDKFAPEIKADFLGACATLYFLRPRSNFDPETGEEIETEASGLIPFRLWPEQQRTARVMLDQQRRRLPVRVVKVKPRQSGDSSYGEVWQFHQIYWGRQEHGITVAHNDKTTASLHAMTKTLYAELPPELRLQHERKNSQELAFADPYGNSIIAQTAGNVDIGHGLTLRHAHLSELPLWLNPEKALEGLMEAIAMTAGTSIYIEAKAQESGDWFHTFWKNSKRGLTGFTPLFTPFYLVPEYRWPVPADFEPTDEEAEWMSEFGVKPAQVMWYRLKKLAMIAKEPWGGERRMRSSYPLTDEEAFQSSGFCIFPDLVLARLQAGVSGPKKVVRLEMMPEPGQLREVADDPDPSRPQLWIWKEPEAGRWYSLGADISDGVSQSESVVSVVAFPGYEQVAEWASDRSSVEETAYVLRYLAERYGGHNTLIIPETNRNGALVLHILFNLPGSYSIFRWRYLNRPGIVAGDNAQLGWQTNDSTKKALAQVANLVFLRGEGHIRSEILYEEMKLCIDIGMRWRGQGGRSDRVVALLIAFIGAYLDFEGGSAGNIVGDRPRDLNAEVPIRDPATYDAGWEKILDAPQSVTSMFEREDLA